MCTLPWKSRILALARVDGGYFIENNVFLLLLGRPDLIFRCCNPAHRFWAFSPPVRSAFFMDSAKCGVTELSQNCWMRKFRSDVWAFVVRKSGHGRLTDRGYPRRPDFAASWPTPTPLRAVKFGDAPLYSVLDQRLLPARADCLEFAHKYSCIMLSYSIRGRVSL